MNIPTTDQLQGVAHKIDPHAQLLHTWTLKGGISAQMTAIEVALANGEQRKLIVRRPNTRTMSLNPHAAADEYKILHTVQAAGVRAQRPYLLDQSGVILPEPYLVVEYIEGEPEYAPADIISFVTQIADQLATLHRVHVNPAELDLPQQGQHISEKLQQRPAALDHALQEGRIRDALEAVWPLPAIGAPSLLHGDFWPGNLLWKDGRLTAIIDWEDAMLGNPLADFATTRLDMLWIFGFDALRAFSQRYQELTRFDFRQLPYWDLVAALRPASRLPVWAEGWPELGRPDITEATMREAHRWFVDQAFERLDGHK
jgi:aminoglycoside phosphotransferase (APT) family kinase protein